MFQKENKEIMENTSKVEKVARMNKAAYEEGIEKIKEKGAVPQ